MYSYIGGAVEGCESWGIPQEQRAEDHQNLEKHLCDRNDDQSDRNRCGVVAARHSANRIAQRYDEN